MSSAPLALPVVLRTLQLGGSARSVLLRERFILFALVTACCCTASALHLLDGPAVLPVALAAIAIAMWHGAYDQVQAQALLAPALGRRWLPAFLIGYAALAALTGVGWWAFPLGSLLLFLLYSAWHFGTEPELWTPGPLPAAGALALGAVPIVAACHWHPAAVTPILAAMLGHSTGSPARAAALTAWLAHGCWPALAAAGLAIVCGLFGRALQARVELLAVLALQAALFFWCDPLLAFAAFFCFWHTPEHLVATSLPDARQQSLRAKLLSNLRTGFFPWLLSLVGLAVVFMLGHREAASYRADIFIVLSALTVPHMLLNELRRAGQGHGLAARGMRGSKEGAYRAADDRA